LLIDISQTGLASGLQFRLFKPDAPIPKDFYFGVADNIQSQENIRSRFVCEWLWPLYPGLSHCTFNITPKARGSMLMSAVVKTYNEKQEFLQLAQGPRRKEVKVVVYSKLLFLLSRSTLFTNRLCRFIDLFSRLREMTIFSDLKQYISRIRPPLKGKYRHYLKLKLLNHLFLTPKVCVIRFKPLVQSELQNAGPGLSNRRRNKARYYPFVKRKWRHFLWRP